MKSFMYAIRKLREAGYEVVMIGEYGARVYYKGSKDYTGLYPLFGSDERPGLVEIEGRVQDINEWLKR